MSTFSRLTDLFLVSDELGHYDENNFSICLYGIKNEPPVIEDIRNRINQITSKYRLIILSKDKYTNVNILDIDL
jgi:hypothetical protein